jgi:hypothetical protein
VQVYTELKPDGALAVRQVPVHIVGLQDGLDVRNVRRVS